MKKIFLQMPSSVFEHDHVFKNVGFNNANFRWIRLKEKLANVGYELTTADDKPLTDCEAIIFHDATSVYGSETTQTKIKNQIKHFLHIKSPPSYPTRDLYTEALDAGLKDKMILLITEGRTVCPQNFLPEIWNKFKTILTWDDDLLDDLKFHKICFSLEPHSTIEYVLPFQEKKLLTNISMNKYSPYKNELYSVRRKAIAYFDKHYPNDFDLYGTRWNTAITRLQRLFPFLVKKYSTYRGVSKDKVKTLSGYKFNLCYENNAQAKGYVTEKIFDSFMARMVPIYLGAPNIEQYVDPNAFIDRRKFKGEKELAEYVTRITEEEYNKYLKAGEQYMKSDTYKEFLPESFCDTVISILNLQ